MKNRTTLIVLKKYTANSSSACFYGSNSSTYNFCLIAKAKWNSVNNKTGRFKTTVFLLFLFYDNSSIMTIRKI